MRSIALLGLLAALLQTSSAAAPPNQDGNCVLTYPSTTVPILSAAGLAIPWVITAGCDQTADTPTFIQGTIYDPATGNLFVYNPLVINVGTVPAVKPTAPAIPAGAIITLHFGTNGGSTTLADASNGAMLTAANCVNGGGPDNTIFGQFAYCNGPAFFAAVNANLANLNPPIPRLGTDKLGLPCVTTRSFALVDQDPSDNVITTYLLTSDNLVAQNTAANQAALTKAGKTFNVLANGSDNRLVTLLDNIVGCTPYMAPDLANANTPVASLALMEIMAANRQQFPVAKVPLNDPMVVMGDGTIDTTASKVLAYRMGVNQVVVNAATQDQGINFCQNLGAVPLAYYAAWANAGLTTKAPSPDTGVATNMATFLGARYQAAWTLLGCDVLTGKPSPITCFDAKGAPAGDNPAARCSISIANKFTTVMDANQDNMPDAGARNVGAASDPSGLLVAAATTLVTLLVSLSL